MRLIADRFLVKHTLGRGGMGAVYLCDDIHPSPGSSAPREVAVKVVPGTASATDSPRLFASLVREFKALQALSHENVVPVYESGVYSDAGSRGFWFSMEWIIGDPAHAYPYDNFEEFADVVIQVCRGLASVHFELDRVHGDLKPTNILVAVDRNGRRAERGSRSLGVPHAYILDFGLTSTPASRQPGAIEGTVYYLAPECAPASGKNGGKSASRVTHQSDLYSLGCTLFHVLAGRPPYSAASVAEILAMHRDPAVGPEVPEHSPTIQKPIPEPIRQLVRWLMATAPENRPSTVYQVMEYLASQVLHRPITLDPSALPLPSGNQYYVSNGLQALLEQVSQSLDQPGTPNLWWIDANAGMGKTAMFGALAEQMGDSPHMLVLRGTGEEELFFGLIRELQQALATADSRKAVAPIPATGPAIAQGLRALTSPSRVVVLLDNMQYASEHDLALLVDVSAQLQQDPVAFLVAGDLSSAKVASRILGRAGTRIPMSPLSPTQIREMIEGSLQAIPSDDLVAHVADVSQGVPGQAVAALRRMSRAGALLVSTQEPRTIEVRLDDHNASASEHLPDNLRQALAAVAVFGRDVSADALARLLSIPESAARDSLGALARLGRLEPLPSGSYRLSRVEAVAVLDALPQAAIVRLRAASAAFLKDSDDLHDRWDRIRHLRGARDRATAAAEALVLAEAAIDLRQPMLSLATQSALSALDDVRRIQKQPAFRLSAKVRAHELLGDIYLKRDHQDESVFHYRKAASLARNPISTARLLQKLATVLMRRYREHRRKADATQGHRALDKAFALLKEHEDPDTQAALLHARAELLLAEGRSEEAVEHHQERLRILHHVGAPTAKATVELAYALMQRSARQSMSVGDALELAQRGLQEAKSMPPGRLRDESLARAQMAIGAIQLTNDNLTESATCSLRAYEIARSLGDWRRAIGAGTNAAYALSHCGPPARAKGITDTLLSTLRHREPTRERALLLEASARVAMQEARYVTATRLANEALKTLRKLGDPSPTPWIVLAATWAELRQQDETLAAVAQIAKHQQLDYQLLAATAMLEAHLWWMDDTSKAVDDQGLQESIRVIVNGAASCSQAGIVGLAVAVAAEATASIDGRIPRKTASALESALKVVRRTNASCFVVPALLHAATALDCVGKTTRALDLATEAEAAWVRSEWVHLGYGWRLHELFARLLKRSGNPDLASTHLLRAGETIETIGSSLVAEGNAAMLHSYFQNPRILRLSETIKGDQVA